MKIITGYPPNYEAISEAFDIKDNDGVVFTYGNKLFVPSGNKIDKPLMKHEETHARQQANIGVEEWWDRYLEDVGFRFSEELEAYRNQYRAMANLPLEIRIGYLNHCATDLAGPIYGNLVSKEEAMAAITKDIILKRIQPGGKNIRKLKKLKRQNRKKGRK